METNSKKDVDIKIVIRSSTESVKQIEEITTMVVELLTTDLKLLLVEKNIILNRTADKDLVTITSRLMSS